MPIRITGMSSGLDTEAIVSALVSSYDFKKEKYVKAQTKLSWKQEAWGTLNTKVYNLYTDIGNMRYSSAYSLKKTTVSDSTKATVTASGEAVNSTQSLRINKLAKAGYLTGGKLTTPDGEGKITKDTKLVSLGYNGGSSQGKINVTSEGKTTAITVDQNTTVSDFVNKLKDAGVNANYDEANNRIFVGAKESGSEHDFTITAGDNNGIDALSAFGLLTKDAKDAYTSKATTFATYNAEGKYDAGTTNSNIHSAIKTLHDLATEYNAAGTTDERKAQIETLFENFKEPVSGVDSAADKYLKLMTQYKPNYTMNDWLQTDVDSLSTAIWEEVDTAAKVKDGTIDLTNDNTADRIEGADAEIVLNGATFTNSTNSFTINGLTIQAQAVTDGEISITTSTDTSGLYDKVKEFLSSYNSVINEMMKLYNADSSSGYEPLSDDEKNEMSDKEIEKWEAKIKDSLLRRDSTLSNLISTMTSAMMSTLNINGETLSWSTFGIGTLGFLNASKNENYAYHIDGDTEDSKTSGKEDKLTAALAADPDRVIEFMKGMSSKLYSALDEKMKSNAVSSVYTVYNDKEMASEYSSYNSLIKQWTNRVSDLEDSYYKKFSKMESALSKLQGNSSSISSLLG